MKVLRVAALVVALAAVTRNAGAEPIEAYGGWLDGVLRVLDYGIQNIEGTDYLSPIVVRREYVLGVDFFPAVPLNFTLNGIAYEDCIDSPNPLVPDCTENALPRVLGDTGTGPFPAGTFGDPALQAPLDLGCTPYGNRFSNNPVLLVARGTCSFSDKWETAQDGGWGGLLVVEAPGVAPGGTALLAGSPDFDVPMFRITSEAAGEIRRGSAFPDEPGLYRGVPWIYMSVSWSPTRPEPVPEPSSLALFAIGAGLIATRRRRT